MLTAWYATSHSASYPQWDEKWVPAKGQCQCSFTGKITVWHCTVQASQTQRHIWALTRTLPMFLYGVCYPFLKILLWKDISKHICKRFIGHLWSLPGLVGVPRVSKAFPDKNHLLKRHYGVNDHNLKLVAMLHGSRQGCNPHSSLWCHWWRHNSETIREREKRRPPRPWNPLSYPMVKTASLYNNFCKTGNDVIYDVIIWVQDRNSTKWLKSILVLVRSTI